MHQPSRDFVDSLARVGSSGKLTTAGRVEVSTWREPTSEDNPLWGGVTVIPGLGGTLLLKAEQAGAVMAGGGLASVLAIERHRSGIRYTYLQEWYQRSLKASAAQKVNHYSWCSEQWKRKQTFQWQQGHSDQMRLT